METREIMSFPGKNHDVLLPGEQPEIEKNPLDDIFGKLNRVDEKVWWPVRDVLLGNADGKNPLGSLDSLLNGKTTIGASNGNSIMNTYPFGKKSDIFQNLFAVCRGERTLEEVLAYIDEWCEKSGKKFGLGEDKHVLLLTDKWDDAVFDKYRDKFRRRAMHEDFWFFFVKATDTKWVDISPFPVELYEFTRHKENQSVPITVMEDELKLGASKDGLSRSRIAFEGLADVQNLLDEDYSIYFTSKTNDADEIYCVTCGSYRKNGCPKIAVAIGLWDKEQKVFVALDGEYSPFHVADSNRAKMIVGKYLSTSSARLNLLEKYKEYKQKYS